MPVWLVGERLKGNSLMHVGIWANLVHNEGDKDLTYKLYMDCEGLYMYVKENYL